MEGIVRFPALAILLAAVSACGGNGPTSPSDSALRLSETIETPSYVFHYSAGDRVDPNWQETYHAWALQELQVQLPRRISYNKYLNRTHMGDLTGHYNTNAYATASIFEAHTIWPTDNHEVVHLMTSTFGAPVALFNEGIAVAMQVNPPQNDFVPKWSGVPPHDRARNFRATGQLIAIASLIDTAEFRTFDANIIYPEAGSFMRFIYDRYGLGPLRQLFALGTPTDSRSRVRQSFQQVYGIPIDQAEQDWLSFLAR